MQVIEFARRLDAKIAAERPGFAKFPVNFPGDRFEWGLRPPPGSRRVSPNLAGLLSEILSLLRRP